MPGKQGPNRRDPKRPDAGRDSSIIMPALYDREKSHLRLRVGQHRRRANEAEAGAFEEINPALSPAFTDLRALDG